MATQLKRPAGNTGIVAVHQTLALAATVELLDLPVATLDAVKDSIVDYLHNMPVNSREHSKSDNIAYFVFIGDEWRPVKSGEIETDENSPLFNALRWKDSQGHGGIAKAYEWAKATPDGKIDYHWLN